MTDREKLVELAKPVLTSLPFPWCTVWRDVAERIADAWLANGVTFPKHAHWTINGKWAECSNCREGEKIAVLVHKDYCPACGAIMDEESVVIHP